MSEIKLIVRDSKDKTKIAKTYTAESYELFMGTIDDFIEIIDLEKINDKNEVAKMALKSYQKLKPIVMDVFPELSNEEYRNIAITDMVMTIVQIGTSIVNNLEILKSKN